MDRAFQDISNFIFMEDAPAKADILFIPGCGHPQVAERAAELYKLGFAAIILPSGRHASHKEAFGGAYSKRELYPGPYARECDFLRDVLVKNGVAAKDILCEGEAMFTWQNAAYSRRLTDKLGIQVSRAILCCQPYHARRSFMYYARQYPGAEILVCPAPALGIDRDNWFTTKAGVDMVMGEMEKCGAQFKGLYDEGLPV